MADRVDGEIAGLVGAEARRLRGARGWTLRQAARETSLSFSYLRRIESGASASSAAYAAIARAHGLTLSRLYAVTDRLFARTKRPAPHSIARNSRTAIPHGHHPPRTTLTGRARK